MTVKKEELFVKRGDSRTLVVMIHGFTGDPASFDGVRRAIEDVDDFADADFYAPWMPFTKVSRARPADVVATIVDKIDQRWQERERAGSPYQRIYLIGHSMGGLFVRKAYVCASGTHPEAPVEPEYDRALGAIGAESCETPRVWAPHVERVVLLAALNRGWSISQHLGLKNGLLWSAGSFFGRLVTRFTGERPLVFAIRKGSPFITQLRVQWIRMRQRAEESGGSHPGGAVTVQLLGSVDDLVSPDDSIDVVSGRDFYYIDVPYSSHKTIMQMKGASPHEEERRARLVTALSAEPAWLESETIPPVDEEIVVQRGVTDVVFVIHGIRDHGYWTQKIARRVVALGQNAGRRVVPETSTYGYFPMLPFIWPAARRKKVEWLMDQYAEAVARYPHAEFAYMGHSNGTYLVARALKDYPVARFTNIVFAGSVVVTDYPWSTYIEDGRVSRVLNYTTTTDAVVAFFPKLFQRPRWQDLGSAGHDGFDQAGDPGVLELGPIRGGHSAARMEPEWDAIAEFLLDGTDVTTSNAAPGQNLVVRALGFVPLVVWLMIIAVIVGIGVALVRLLSDEILVVAMIAYLVAVWRLLTRL